MSAETETTDAVIAPQPPSVGVAWHGAWRGFKGWWISLCFISFLLLMTQSWIPNKIVEELPELAVFQYPKQEVVSFVQRSTSLRQLFDFQRIQMTANRILRYFRSDDTQALLFQLFKKIILIFTIASFVAIFVHLTLILVSMAACHDDKKLTHSQRCKLALKKAPKLYFSYLVLGFIKVLPWFFFILPGLIYGSMIGIIIGFIIGLISGSIVYIRLYFTGFIITEESTNPFLASKKSWELTSDHFGVIFVIFLITLVLDSIGVLTAGIGLIPGTSVKYTLRASMYNQLLEFNERKGKENNG